MKAAGEMTQSAKTGLQRPQRTAHSEERTTVVGKMKIHSFKRGPGRPKKPETVPGDDE